jgi:hypothetical protein
MLDMSTLSEIRFFCIFGAIALGGTSTGCGFDVNSDSEVMVTASEAVDGARETHLATGSEGEIDEAPHVIPKELAVYQGRPTAMDSDLVTEVITESETPSPEQVRGFRVSGNMAQVQWVIDTSLLGQELSTYESVQLQIMGPNGFALTRTLSVESELTVEAQFPNGGFNWEMVFTPIISESTREKMTDIRGKANRAEAEALVSRLRQAGELPALDQIERNKQSGYFTIADGALVSSVVEGE